VSGAGILLEGARRPPRNGSFCPMSASFVYSLWSCGGTWSANEIDQAKVWPPTSRVRNGSSCPSALFRLLIVEPPRHKRLRSTNRRSGPDLPSRAGPDLPSRGEPRCRAAEEVSVRPVSASLSRSCGKATSRGATEHPDSANDGAIGGFAERRSSGCASESASASTLWVTHAKSSESQPHVSFCNRLWAARHVRDMRT
jgi:hypothetical protein